MDYYAVKAWGNVEEFIQIDSGLMSFKSANIKSALQFFDKKKLILDASEIGGTEFPDLIIYETMFLFSNNIVGSFRKRVEEYVLLKPIEIRCEVIGKRELYWLVIPPRIDCLDMDKSIVEKGWDFSFGVVPMLHCDKTVIDEELTGHYEMFKVAATDDNNVYVSEEIRNMILREKPVGIQFVATERS